MRAIIKVVSSSTLTTLTRRVWRYQRGNQNPFRGILYIRRKALYNKSIPKYRSKVNFAGILLSSAWIRILIVFTASVIYCEPTCIRWNQFPWFLKMHWSMASWIRGIKLYGHFVWFKWTTKSAKIRTPRLIMISQYDFGPNNKKRKVQIVMSSTWWNHMF
jgi:hypothetical protein